jgi:hypothetical protein
LKIKKETWGGVKDVQDKLQDLVGLQKDRLQQRTTTMYRIEKGG